MGADNNIGAIIIGCDFQALGIIRSLAEKNIPVFLIEHEFGISRFSRFVKRRTFNSKLLNPEHFPNYLIEIAKRENLKDWVLFPNNDEIVQLLSINRDILKKWFKIPVSSWEEVKKYYYKENTYRTADSIGISIPKLYNFDSLKHMLNSNIKYPIVLKPMFKEGYCNITKKKAIKINNQEELINEYNKMASLVGSSNIIAQEMIEGAPDNLYSYAAFFDGEEIVAGLSVRRLRQHPIEFGTSTYVEVVEIPEIEELSSKILKEIGFWGVAEVEFMKDAKDNKYKLIEINGRIFGWHILAKAAGINLAHILYQHMTGQNVETTKAIKGVKWIRLITDIPTVLKELFAMRIKFKDYFNSLNGKKVYAVFSLKDPLPFFAEWIMIPYLWFKRGF